MPDPRPLTAKSSSPLGSANDFRHLEWTDGATKAVAYFLSNIQFENFFVTSKPHARFQKNPAGAATEQSLMRHQARALAGKWYNWWTARHANAADCQQMEQWGDAAHDAIYAGRAVGSRGSGLTWTRPD
jgi:hypothetical protein